MLIRGLMFKLLKNFVPYLFLMKSHINCFYEMTKDMTLFTKQRQDYAENNFHDVEFTWKQKEEGTI